jgi:hypothetical protein
MRLAIPFSCWLHWLASISGRVECMKMRNAEQCFMRRCPFTIMR